MKKLVAFVWLAICALAMVGCSNPKGDVDNITLNDYLLEQELIDETLIAEMKAGYSYSEPLVVVNPYGNAPLSAVIIFTTDKTVGGMVCVNGKADEDDLTFEFEKEKEHLVPIIGLYAAETTTVELTLDTGEKTVLQIAADAVDLGLSNYSVEMKIADEYDYSSLTVCGNMILHCYAGYDSKGDLRWAITNTGANAFTQLDNGHFLIPNVYGHGSEFPNGLTGVREMDAIGKVYNVYVWNGGQHHEIYVMDNGNYMCTGSKPGYETNRDYLFEIDRNTGEVVWELNIADIITPGSSGCESDKGQDWCHCNALTYDKNSDTLFVSCRHLCSVLAIDYSDKKLKWIFGDPAGWSEDYSEFLLTGVGEDFDWAYGQHQINLLSNGDIIMFDNGTFSRVKEVNKDKAVPAEQNYSRAVVYRIDENNKSVSKIWEYGRELGSAYQADSMSGVQVLNEKTNDYLVCFGTCEEDNKSLTHIQLIKDNVLVWELNYEGSSTYRASRVVMSDVLNFDPNVVGKWHGDIKVTTQLDNTDISLENAESCPDDISVELFPFNALRFSGSVKFEAIGQKDFYVILSSKNKNYVFDLGYTQKKGNDEVTVTLSRFISLNGLNTGTYKIYVGLNGKVYSTEKTVKIK